MRVFAHFACAAILLAPTSHSLSQPRFAVTGRVVEVASPGLAGETLFLSSRGPTEGITGLFLHDGDILRVDGDVSSRLQLSGRVVAHSVADRARYVACILLNEGKNDGSAELTLEVTDSDLGRLYRVPLEYQADDPFPGVAVAANASVVIAYHAIGRVDFVTPTGTVVASHQLSRGSHDIERAVLVSRPGRHGATAVIVNEPVPGGGLAVASREALIFSPLGEELSRVALPGSTVSSVAISPEGDLIGVGLQDVTSSSFETVFLSDRGRVLQRIDFAAEYIEFDSAGTTVLVADKRQMAVVRPHAAMELMRHRISESSDRLLDFSLSDDADYVVALSARTRFEDGFVHDDIRIHEFARSADQTYAYRSLDWEDSARRVRVWAQAEGVILAFDGSIFRMGREP